MPSLPSLPSRNWSRLARFVAKEDGKIHYGQPVDNELDVGASLSAGEACEVYEVKGFNPPFDGQVDESTKLTISELLSPIESVPGTIRCMGANFRKHVAEAGLKCPKTPVLFIKPPTSLAGPGDIPIPKFVHEDRDEEMGPEQLDFETELAFVVSKDARDITPEQAKDYILGYTSANDITGRFHQFRQAQWNFAKGFDKFCPIGPVLVSPERVGNVCELDFRGCLNGTVMQQDNTNDWIFPVHEALSFLSSGTTVPAGTLCLMGTPSGVGWFCKPKKMLRNGDKFTVWHDGGIGTLENRIVFE